MRNLGNSRNVQDIKAGIAQRLTEYQASVVLNRVGERLRVAGVHEGRFDAKPRQGVGQKIMAAAIKRCGGHDM